MSRSFSAAMPPPAVGLRRGWIAVLMASIVALAVLVPLTHRAAAAETTATLTIGWNGSDAGTGVWPTPMSRGG